MVALVPSTSTYNTHSLPDSDHRSLVAVLSALSLDELSAMVTLANTRRHYEALAAQGLILQANPGMRDELEEAAAHVHEKYAYDIMEPADKVPPMIRGLVHTTTRGVRA